MSLVIDRTAISERMNSVRSLLTFIKENESNAVPPVDSDIVKTLRGLFYVHLYGAFEKSTNEVTEKYLSAVDSIGAKTADYSLSFLPVALDPRFSSLQSADKWESRAEFTNALSSTEPCVISNTVFAMQLQNTWAKTLKKVAFCIGEQAYVLAGRDPHYLDEVVEKRNQVAHGRIPPVDVGSSGRAVDLELRFEAVGRVLEGFTVMLENNFNGMSFLKAHAHPTYKAAADAIV